jgi:hypothetical protein
MHLEQLKKLVPCEQKHNLLWFDCFFHPTSRACAFERRGDLVTRCSQCRGENTDKIVAELERRQLVVVYPQNEQVAEPEQVDGPAVGMVPAEPSHLEERQMTSIEPDTVFTPEAVTPPVDSQEPLPPALRQRLLKDEPPNEFEMEQDLLGGMLQFGEVDNDGFFTALREQALEPADFYQERHRILFVEMLACLEKHGVLTPRLLSAELKGKRKLEVIGGDNYFNELLINYCSKPDSLKAAAQKIKTAALKRMLRETTLRQLAIYSNGATGDVVIQAWQSANLRIQTHLDRYTGAGATLTIISKDPILQAVERALANIVKADSITFETSDRYLRRVREERGHTRVLVEKNARSHSLGMLVGRAWQGKTTIGANRCRSMLLGESFLGYACHPARVGYMALERNGEAVAEWFEKWGIAERVKFVDAVPMGDPRAMASALAFAVRKYELEAVWVDHLIGMVRMMDGNDYVGVSNALAPFNVVTKITGVYLELLHHQPKATATGTEINVMGSEAFRAATDTLMEACKIGSNYFFRAQMRGQNDIERVRVRLLPDGLIAGEESVEGLKAEILDALQGLDKEISSAGLVTMFPELASFHRKTFMRTLKALEEDGQIGREKKRGRYVYWARGGMAEATTPLGEQATLPLLPLEPDKEDL